MSSGRYHAPTIQVGRPRRQPPHAHPLRPRSSGDGVKNNNTAAANKKCLNVASDPAAFVAAPRRGRPLSLSLQLPTGQGGRDGGRLGEGCGKNARVFGHGTEVEERDLAKSASAERCARAIPPPLFTFQRPPVLTSCDRLSAAAARKAAPRPWLSRPPRHGREARGGREGSLPDGSRAVIPFLSSSSSSSSPFSVLIPERARVGRRVGRGRSRSVGRLGGRAGESGFCRKINDTKCRQNRSFCCSPLDLHRV